MSTYAPCRQGDGRKAIMQATWINDDEQDVSGTCLQGTVTTTRALLEQVFGSPGFDAPNGYDADGPVDVTTEWTLVFDGGCVATIYDLINEAPCQPKPHEVVEWRVGGVSAEAVRLVAGALGTTEFCVRG